MPDRREFYRLQICERVLTGTVYRDGPYLALIENRVYDHRVLLGPGLEIVKPAGRHYYAICRNAEPCIVLSQFSEEDVEDVAREFGIPTNRLFHLSFEKSPAYGALKHWIKQHPEIAKTCLGPDGSAAGRASHMDYGDRSEHIVRKSSRSP